MLPAGARILDVGCVDGWVLDEYPLARGVDSRMAPIRWGERVDRCDAENMIHADGSFDAVTCVSVLEHVGLGWYGDPVGDGQKPKRIIAEMARVLAPGGWLLLTVPIDLVMTKDGKPFAREIEVFELNGWIAAAGLTVREWLSVASRLWEAAADDRDTDVRYVALVAAEKAAP